MQDYDRPRQHLHHATKAGWFKRFAREEDGSILILSLQIFIIMLVCTGIAIDMVRQEERRTLIQGTVDRAVLAAAALNQQLDPKLVVKDYLAKAGLDYLEIDPVIEQSDTSSGQALSWRKVSVSVKDNMPTLFGPLMGVTSLASNGTSQAEESVGNVEISLVLDISNSMNTSTSSGKTRIQLLRTAARNFVARMFDTVQPPDMPGDRLSISIVPYNQQVVIGNDLASVLNLSTDHTKNTCVDVQTLGWNSTSISPTTPLLRTHYADNFDFWYYWQLYYGNTSNTGAYKTYTVDSTGNANSSIPGCVQNNAASIMAFSTSRSNLQSKIDTLSYIADGNTSIDIGARWGLALLDPAFQPATAELVQKGKVAGSMVNRPLAFDTNGVTVDETALKVLVLMTDGANTTSYSLKEEYRQGASGLYSTISSTSIRPYGTYYGNVYEEWKQLYYYAPSRSKPWYSFYRNSWYSESDIKSVTGYKKLYSIDWKVLWDNKRYTLQYSIEAFLQYPFKTIYYDLPNDAARRKAVYDSMALQGEYDEKDDNLRSLCKVAKDSNHRIVIYTVAMLDGISGASVLNDCATSSAYAYNVNSSDLNNAFAGIATSITALRLTN
ncbi:pilus assembly protein TadG-related protein [Thioclava sp. A2]|uniref:TadE/TadG family type IV pilus assembly protein n=1 Tax=Thioclava sp. FCG-A2 TaxID=3080562 RepID=UPI002952DC1D|nr:pilus assembly protein TadG-related protein [Thioclava sp. A2]MDV7270965.1 pilus assembly protein TadG-related protein [Thioclava sp. A2]